MQAHASDRVYVNYLGTVDDETMNRLATAYGPGKYARLVALKTKYDPQNFFRLNQNIPPSGRSIQAEEGGVRTSARAAAGYRTQNGFAHSRHTSARVRPTSRSKRSSSVASARRLRLRSSHWSANATNRARRTELGVACTGREAALRRLPDRLEKSG
jgi:hypothetical protein